MPDEENDISPELRKNIGKWVNTAAENMKMF